MSLPYDVQAPPLMVCGHYANATSEGKAACVIHGTTEQDPVQPPPLTEWYCGSCKRTSPAPVAFPDRKSGTHYCGCRGWD